MDTPKKRGRPKKVDPNIPPTFIDPRDLSSFAGSPIVENVGPCRPQYEYKILVVGGSLQTTIEQRFDAMGKEGYAFIAAVPNLGLVFSRPIS
jgi:hypothetical protein